jgi:hypothetical protein
MKFRTIYASNAHGRYIAREGRRTVPGSKIKVWVEISRVYEQDMLLGYPTEVLHE